MDDLAFLRGRVESYADYTNDDDRRLVDEQIRAYVGEALSRLSERLGLVDSAGEALANLLLRCQFADQVLMRVLDADAFAAATIPAIRGVDRELVTLADGADSIAANEVGAYVAKIDAAFDARTRLITGAAAVSPDVPPR